MANNIVKHIKKNLRACFFILVCAHLISCGSSGITQYYRDNIDFSNAELKTNDVQVIVNHAKDKDLSLEAKNYLNMVFARSTEAPADKEYSADLTIIQSSYMRGLDTINSIYGILNVYAPERALVTSTNYFIESKDTIVSAAMQKKIINKLIKCFLEKRNRRVDLYKAPQFTADEAEAGN